MLILIYYMFLCFHEFVAEYTPEIRIAVIKRVPSGRDPRLRGKVIQSTPF